ncbi:hypothetical protein DK37_13225, partial [Halomonas sp. SUBG004]
MPMLSVLAGSLLLAGCATSGQAVRSDANPAAVEAYTQLGVAYLERDNLTRAECPRPRFGAKPTSSR